jgi:hypothetical protein
MGPDLGIRPAELHIEYGLAWQAPMPERLHYLSSFWRRKEISKGRVGSHPVPRCPGPPFLARDSASCEPVFASRLAANTKMLQVPHASISKFHIGRWNRRIRSRRSQPDRRSAAATQRFRGSQDRLKRSLMNSGSHPEAVLGPGAVDDHKAVDVSLQVSF